MEKISINLLKDELAGDAPIEDVSKATWNAIFKKQKVWVVLCAWFAILWAGVFYQITKNDAESSFIGLFIGLFPFLILYAVIYTQTKHEFMRQFASHLGMNYQRNIEVPMENAHFFQVGHSKKAEDYISGVKAGRPISIFSYRFTIGHGKSSHTYTYTVFNIDLPYALPAVIVAPNNGWFAYAGTNPAKDKRAVTLEADLDQQLKLWVEPKFEVEALQIFTKEFLEQIATVWKGFNIELTDNNIYVYSNRVIHRKVDMEHMFALVETIITHTQNMLERVSSSTAAMKLHTTPKQNA